MRKHRWIKALCIMFLVFIAYRAVAPVLWPGGQSGGKGAGQGEEKIVGFMIDKVAAGEVELADENGIRQAILQGEDELGINLEQEDKDRIVGFMKTLDTIETGAGDFIDQAGQMYEKYSAQLVEGANDAINEAVGSAVEGASENFFGSLKQSAQDFFDNLSSPSEGEDSE